MKSIKDLVRAVKDDSLTGAELALEHYTLDVVDKVVTLLRDDFAQGLRCAYRINRTPTIETWRDGWDGWIEQVSEHGIYRKGFSLTFDRQVNFDDADVLYADTDDEPEDLDAFHKADFTDAVLETLARGEFDRMVFEELDGRRYNEQLARDRL
jgi:hypothetical protein